MSDSDTKDINFRDECAIKILQAIFFNSIANRSVGTILDNYKFKSDSSQEWEKKFFRDIEILTKVSYKIADIVRKVRLIAFE